MLDGPQAGEAAGSDAQEAGTPVPRIVLTGHIRAFFRDLS
jgi:hypothetical protein